MLLASVVKQVNCLSTCTCIHALFTMPTGKRKKFALLFLFPYTEERIASENGNRIIFIYEISLRYCWLSS